MENLSEIKATVKIGNEKLKLNDSEIGYCISDFWKWSVSDILSNATRGRFAEFIVGTAIGLNPKNVRDEWSAYDLITENGVKIEVKSASYIQSWQQKEYSKISFSIKTARNWENEEGLKRGKPKRQADIYVFCLLKHKNQETINPLNLEQWDFFVLPTYRLDNYERSQHSITLNSLSKLTNPIGYDKLKDEILKSYEEQNSNAQ
jgi:hypothetical protein